jgi:hypothetical protein
MFLTKTYAIEDCTYYSTTSYPSSSTTINHELMKALPSGDCSISWEENVGNSSDTCFVRVGADNSANFVNVGIISDNGGAERIWTYNNGSYIEKKTTGKSITRNTWVTKEITITNGVLTYQSVSATSSKTFNYTYLLWLYHKYTTVKNFKIKPL